MNTNRVQAPVSATITEVEELLRRNQMVAFSTRTNQWGGLDFYGINRKPRVRVTNDDGQINVYVMENGGPMGTSATFTHMPAGVIVAVVEAYLV